MTVSFRLRVLCAFVFLGGCASPDEIASPTVQGSQTQSIVGGANTTIETHPWQVTLQSFGGHMCGASVVHAGWVLTANHCLQGVSAADIAVVAGVAQLSEVNSGQIRAVANIHRYPNFFDPGDGRDIALLELENPFDLSTPQVKAVPVVTEADASAGALDAGVMATATGWGALQEGGFQTPNTLQAVDVPLVSLASAQQAYQQNLSTDQLGAGFLGQGGADSCQGDSGGPLTVMFGGVRKQAGVVSWGYGCGDPNFPGMYARVASYANWIAGFLPAAVDVDAELSGVVEPAADGMICDSRVEPQVTLRNSGADTLTSVSVSYSFDGAASQTFAWTGSLTSGAATTINLPATPLTGGEHTFSVSLSSPNGVTDENPTNNSVDIEFGVAQPMPLPLEGTFEGANPLGDWSASASAAELVWTASAPGGFGDSATSLRMDNYNNNAPGGGTVLFSPFMDLSNTNNAELSFSIAYGPYPGQQDGLQAYVSADCGQSWEVVFDQQGDTLATAAPTEDEFVPTASQWRAEQLDLGAFAGLPSVIVALQGVNDYGNFIYIDDIAVRDPAGTDIDGDGVTVGDGDCNDNNPAIFPGAAEQCDGDDNNCDGQRDEGLSQSEFWADIDGDGFGNGAAGSTFLCDGGPGWVLNADDCNDTDPSLTGTGQALPLQESFENGVPPAGWVTAGETVVSWDAADFGGLDASSTSAVIDNFDFDTRNTEIVLRTPALDFSGALRPSLTFQLAYAVYDNELIDRLRVRVSVDCGLTWSSVFERAGLELATSDTPSEERFEPNASQWREETIDLVALEGEPSVLIAFENLGGYGQALYIDDVAVVAEEVVVDPGGEGGEGGESGEGGEGGEGSNVGDGATPSGGCASIEPQTPAVFLLLVFLFGRLRPAGRRRRA